MSHSTRVRGLKLIELRLRECIGLSHSTRVRGLKYATAPQYTKTFDVALYTSAWIEIEVDSNDEQIESVALYTSAWIEIAPVGSPDSATVSRTLHECVD